MQYCMLHTADFCPYSHEIRTARQNQAAKSFAARRILQQDMARGLDGAEGI
jgi:hypothetical protein